MPLRLLYVVSIFLASCGSCVGLEGQRHSNLRALPVQLDVTPLFTADADKSNVCHSTLTLPSRSSGTAATQGSSGSESGEGVVVLPDGSAVYTGFSVGLTYADCLIMYFSPDLEMVWANSFGTHYDDRANSVVLSPDLGTVYVSGYMNGTLNGVASAFVACFVVASGNLLWATAFPASFSEFPTSVAVTATGDVLLAGNVLTSSTDAEALLTCLNGTSGQVLWSSALSAPSGVHAAQGVVRSRTSSVIVGTSQQSSVTVPSLLAAKFDSTGALLWARTLNNGLDTLSVYGTAVDVTTSTVVVSGYVLGALGSDLLLASLDLTDGSLWWVTLAGGRGVDQGSDVLISSSVIYIVGETTTFGSGDRDVLLLAVDPVSGQLVWGVAMGGQFDDTGSALAFNDTSTLVVTGYSSSFGSGGTDVLTLSLEQSTGPPVYLDACTITPVPSGYATVQQFGSWSSTSISNSWDVLSPLMTPALSVLSQSLSSYSSRTTWLTFTLSMQWPLINDALLLFEWNYALPVPMYSHLPNAITVNLVTDADWVSLDASGTVLSGVPVLQSFARVSMSLEPFGYIQGVGVYSFRPISMQLCISATPAVFFEALNYGEQAFGNAVTQDPNGDLFLIGGTMFSGQAWDVALARFDDLGAVQFVTSYGGAGDDQALAVLSMANGNLMAAGSTDSFGAGSYDILVFQVNSTGGVVWALTVGGPSDDEGYAMVYLPTDDTYMVTGWTNSYGAGGYDTFLLKVASNGDVVLFTTFGDENDNFGYTIATAANFTSLAVSGWTDSSALGNGSTDVFVTYHASESCDLVWVTLFGGLGFDAGYSVIGDDMSDGVIVTGTTDSWGAGSYDVFVANVSAVGIVEFVATTGGPGDDEAYWLVASGSSLFVTGYTDSYGAGGYDVLLFELMLSSVEMPWAEVIGGAGDDFGFCILQASGGDVVVGGQTDSFQQSEMLLFRATQSGDLSRNTAIPSSSIVNLLSTSVWVPAQGNGSFVSTNVSTEPLSIAPSIFTRSSSGSYQTLSSLEFLLYNGPVLPPITQVKFGVQLSINASQYLSANTIVVGALQHDGTQLPTWLTFNRRTGTLSGLPFGTVRGLYYIDIKLQVLEQQQRVTFVLNVTDTAPYYDGPLQLQTGVGDFSFSLRPYWYDAEGDSISNFQLGLVNGRPPGIVATVNPATADLQGTASVSGTFALNMSAGDPFAAVGWCVIKLTVTSPAPLLVVSQSVIPILVALFVISFTMFVLWWRDTASVRTDKAFSSLAREYCHPLPQDPPTIAALSAHRDELVRVVLQDLNDDARFASGDLWASVRTFCDNLLMFTSSSSSDRDFVHHCSISKICSAILKTVTVRLSKRQLVTLQHANHMARSQYPPVYHQRTLLLLQILHQLVQTMLLCCGAQLEVAPKELSLLQGACGCVQCACSSSARDDGGESIRAGVDHDLHHRWLRSVRAITAYEVGFWGLESFGTGCCSKRKPGLLELQLYHAMECTTAAIVCLPDTASAGEILLGSVFKLFSPTDFASDLRFIAYDVPSNWYVELAKYHLRFLSLLHTSGTNRLTELVSIQEDMFTSCFSPPSAPLCGCRLKKMAIGDWRLVFGVILLIGDALKTPGFTAGERAQLRGTSTPQSQGLLTLASLTAFTGYPIKRAWKRWITSAARNVLEQSESDEALFDGTLDSSGGTTGLMLNALRSSALICRVVSDSPGPQHRKYRLGLSVRSPVRTSHAVLPFDTLPTRSPPAVKNAPLLFSYEDA